MAGIFAKFNRKVPAADEVAVSTVPLDPSRAKAFWVELFTECIRLSISDDKILSDREISEVVRAAAKVCDLALDEIEKRWSA